MSDIDYSALANELAGRFCNDDRILGSKVGSWLKERHPGIDFASEGGLRSFIATHLSSVLAWHSKDEKSKLDDRYRLVGENVPQPEHRATLSSEQSGVGNRALAWDAFVNPASPYKNKLTLDAGALRVQGIDSTDPSALQLPSVSRDEERGIYEKFLLSEHHAGMDKLRSAMEEDNYQRAWYLALRDPDLGEVRRSWGKFRFDRLLEIFRSRLSALALPASESAVIVDQLVAAYEAGRPQKKEAPAAAGGRAAPSTTTLAAFARAAVSEMSDSELMQLWVPLHVVLKAAGKLR
jgi:hypothetical protein